MLYYSSNFVVDFCIISSLFQWKVDIVYILCLILRKITYAIIKWKWTWTESKFQIQILWEENNSKLNAGCWVSAATPLFWQPGILLRQVSRRCSTCALFLAVELSHVIFLMLRKKEQLAKLSKFTKWQLFSLKMILGCR